MFGGTREMDAMVDTRRQAAVILARLDRLPATRTMWTMVALLSLGGLFEFYDLFMTAYVIPGFIKAGMLTGLGVGIFQGPALFVASTFFGLFIGTAVFGFVADHYGRRTVFTVSMLWYCAATLIMASICAGAPSRSTRRCSSPWCRSWRSSLIYWCRWRRSAGTAGAGWWRSGRSARWPCGSSAAACPKARAGC
jgi:MFS family permease